MKSALLIVAVATSYFPTMASTALAVPVKAPAITEQPIICITIARVWRGNAQDIHDIEKIPVPESYKDKAAQTGCEGWSFVRESLIVWHFRFGSERSTSAALTYFEAHERPKTTPTPQFGHVLTQALARWDRSSLSAQVTPSAKNHHLKALIGEWATLVYWADIKLHAAELFNSQTFRAKAEDDLSRALAGYDAFTAFGASADANALGDLLDKLAIDKQIFAQAANLELRMAILKARQSGDPVDVLAASALVDKDYRKAYTTALHVAERANYFLCQPDPESNGDDEQFAQIRGTCNDDDDFKSRVERFWIYRAEVDLLMAADPSHFAIVGAWIDHSGSKYAPIGKDLARKGDRQSNVNAFDLAVSAIELAAHMRGSDSPDLAQEAFPFRVTCDPQIDLALQMAEARLKLGDGIQSGTFPKDAKIPGWQTRLPADPTFDAGEQWSEGMQQLVPASLLVLPTEYPSRFRQIARLYEILFERAAKLGDDRPTLFDNEARAADYFRQTLAKLDDATAADGVKP